jgi:hypothetical protein
MSRDKSVCSQTKKTAELVIQPEASVYCNYDYATETKRCEIRAKVYDQINEIQKKNDDIYKTSIKLLSLLALLPPRWDSSESEFNEITGGLRLKAPSLISETQTY